MQYSIEINFANMQLLHSSLVLLAILLLVSGPLTVRQPGRTLANVSTLMDAVMSFPPSRTLNAWNTAKILDKKKEVKADIIYLQRNLPDIATYGVVIPRGPSGQDGSEEKEQVRQLAIKFDAHPDLSPAWRPLWLSLHKMVNILDDMLKVQAETQEKFSPMWRGKRKTHLERFEQSIDPHIPMTLDHRRKLIDGFKGDMRLVDRDFVARKKAYFQTLVACLSALEQATAIHLVRAHKWFPS